MNVLLLRCRPGRIRIGRGVVLLLYVVVRIRGMHLIARLRLILLMLLLLSRLIILMF